MKLDLDPDRLFPVDPATREVARELYTEVAALPILSPHGHVDPAILLGNVPFPDPAELLIRYDHYVTRLMHAAGVRLSDLGIPDRLSNTPVAAPRDVWRTFCAHWHLYAGTASGYWLQHEFSELFGIDQHPDAQNADALFDTIQAALATDAFRRGRCSIGSASRSSPPPTTRWTTSPCTGRWPTTPPSPAGCCPPSVPTPT